MKTFYSIIIFLALFINACVSQPKPLVSKNYEEQTDDLQGNVLVAYATRAGSTIEVADSIAYAIAGKGYIVELKHIDEVSDLSPYSAIIFGSAIRMGNVTPEMKKFVESNKVQLESIPTAYFIVCLTMKDDTPENREKVAEYLTPLRTLVQPFAEGYFAGKMDYSRLKRFDRFVAKRLVKAPEGDFREWNKIRKWAEELL